MNFYDFNGMRGYGNQSAENGNGKQNSCNFAGQNCDTESKNQSFEDWTTAFCNRKYDSDFSREMTRSVEKYLEQFSEKGL